VSTIEPKEQLLVTFLSFPIGKVLSLEILRAPAQIREGYTQSIGDLPLSSIQERPSIPGNGDGGKSVGEADIGHRHEFIVALSGKVSGSVCHLA
jgi:hypothetical protein